MSIKKVNQKDKDVIEALVEVWLSSVEATHSFLTMQAIKEMKPEVRTGLYKVPLLYCYDDGGIIGFIGVEEENVDMLFVDAQHREHGIGKKLFRFAIDELGIKTVDVNEQNEQALGFYQHMGFEVQNRSELDDRGRPFPILHLKEHDD